MKGKVIEKAVLVFSDLAKNSYKQYEIALYEDNSVVSKFGVVGVANPQECDYGVVGKAFYDKKIKEKCRKGYEHAKVISDVPTITSGAALAKQSLADIALAQIHHSNDTVKTLIRRLANSNVHKITASTSISFNETSGLFQTPLGVVTSDAIADARNLLGYFNSNPVSSSLTSEYKNNIDKYLRLIPRVKGYRMSYESIFPDQTAIQKESDLLDALQGSLDILAKPQPQKAGEKSAPVEKVFNLRIDRLEDPKERDRIIAKYNATNKAMHHYGHVKIREIYVIDIVDYNKAFDEKVGNNVEVWHGSGEANILSIAKVGLKCSPPSTAAIAGKMFGNGVYGSETVSKAMGYTLGRWTGNQGDSGWLFICDFAMGKPFYPNGSISRIPAGYDSCWALPKNTSLLNDELIVYREPQIRIKYLLEIK